MTRLALAGKWGSPGRPPDALAVVGAAAASRSRRVARAAVPIPRPDLAKKWRRVRPSRLSRRGSMRLFLGDRLVQVQDQVGQRRVRRELGGGRPLVAGELADR